MARVDVTVRGAGIFGLSIAWACLRRGANVRVIDPRGVGQGASGGIVGALAPHVPEQWNAKKQFQLESLLMAESWWRDVEGAGGRSAGYRRSGRIQPLPDAAAVELARQRERTARDHWGDLAMWQVIPASGAAWPLETGSGFAVHDTLSALIHPRRAVEALAAALVSSGAEIARDGPEEGKVLWATGWEGLEEMSAAHTRSVGAGVKGQAILLDFAAPDRAQLFAGGLHIIPHTDGTLAIGSTTERDFENASRTDAQCDVLRERAAGIIPALADAPVIERWAGIRPRARSRAPMLGRHPFRDGFVANGGFKIGFGMAPRMAEIMADLMLEGRDEIPADFSVAANL